MDHHGVHMVALTLTGGMPCLGRLPPKVRTSLKLLTWLPLSLHTRSFRPNRFIAGIDIPVRDPQMVFEELNRMLD